MKTLAVSLIALSALSTATFAAGNRSWDVQDRQYYNTSGVSEPTTLNTKSKFDVLKAPLAVEGRTGVSAFDRMNWLSYWNDHGRH